MKLKILFIFAAIMLAACNAADTKPVGQANNTPAPAPATAAHPPQANDGVKRVTTAELEKLMKDGKVVVLDVRSQSMYDAGHIQGAKLIPVPDLATRVNELPRDKMIVTYCS